MHIADFSVRNPVLVNLLMGAIIIMGFLLSFSLPLEMFPSVKTEIVTVRTIFPGSSAEDMEQFVSLPIEQEIKNLSGIKTVKSVSSEGMSFVTAEVYQGEDTSRVAWEIETRIAQIRDQIPADAEEPVVDDVEAVFPLASVSVSGNVSKDALFSVARKFRDDLLFLDGIGSVDPMGLPEPAFRVFLDYAKMMQFYVSVDDVSSAITARNMDMPGGKIGQGEKEFLLSTKGRIRSVEDLLRIPVRRSAEGNNILLRDIAAVSLGENREFSRSRINGNPAVIFWVKSQKNVDVINTMKTVRSLAKRYESELPRGMIVTISGDMSVRVEQRFRTMVRNGLLGFLLVLAVLALFIDRRAAMIAALGIPISFLGAVILMKLAGITLNLLSMFGLVMMLGIVVDDSIIVVENVQRYIARGMDPAKAAVVGTKEVALPVIATILTNVFAFLPLLLATGLIGQFLSVIPKVAIFALCFSLMEALLIMPSHCADWIKPGSVAKPGPAGVWLMRIRRFYLRGLVFTIRNRYVVTGCFLVVFLLSVGVFSRMPNVMFYFHDVEEVIMRVENSLDSSLQYTSDSLGRMEDVIRNTIPPDLLKSALVMVGVDMTNEEGPVFGDHLGSIMVEYTDYSERKENMLDISRATEKKMQETVVGPKQIDMIASVGLPVGKPVDVKISGEDVRTLIALTSSIEKFLRTQRGVSAVNSNLAYGKPEVRVEVDEEKAAVFGLDTRRVAREIKLLGDGMTVASTRVGREEAEIILEIDMGDADALSMVKSHQISTPSGERVSLGTVAQITQTQTPLEIRREKLRRTATVTAEIDSRATTSEEVRLNLTPYLDRLLEKYPKYSYRFAGEQEDYSQAMDDIIKAAIASIILIYLVLATMLGSYFQPFIIMSVLPLTITGVLTGVLIRGEPMTLPAIIGMVALLGIVVNDSLVLMDFINRRVKTMPSKVAAVVFSAKYRFRPIVLTTITTFLGLSSLMFIYKGQSSFMAPMAISLGFGLLLSTFIILYLVPCLYMILDDLLKLWKNRPSLVAVFARINHLRF